MKRLLLYGLLFFFGCINAQNVYILDASFKNKLLAADTSNAIAKDNNGNSIRIDANNDGEIQLSEAQLVAELDVSSSNIFHLSGINAFPNLKSLKCQHNAIQALNLTGNPDLEFVECYDNMVSSIDLTGLIHLSYLDCRLMAGQLTSLNLTGLTGLKILKCGRNNLTSLNLSAQTNLIELDCSISDISNLNLSGLLDLKTLDCSSSLLSSLDVTSLVNLENFDYSYNNLASLNISSLTSLKKLSCNAIGLTSLDLSPFPNLVSLSCHSNLLTALDLSNLNNLTTLECGANQLTSLDVSNLTNVTSLMCGYNQLTALDLSGLNNLEYVDCSNNTIAAIGTQGLDNLVTILCSNNSITELDMSQSPHITFLSCENNSLLETINLKNGTSFTEIPVTGFEFQNTPSLAYVCSDEEESELLQSFFSGFGNIAVSPYCTFTPGGDYNTITGMIRLDAHGNGCEASDDAQPFIKMKISNGTEEESAFLNSEANYAFYTQDGTFTVTPAIENASFFSFGPTNALVNFPDVENRVHTQDFCVTPNGSHSDVEIAIAPIVPARPGFDAVYKVVYKNNGNQTISQTSGITLLYNQNLMSFVSSTPAERTQSPGRISWDYTDLHPFESRSFNVTMNINRPTDGNPVNINDVLNFTASVTLPNGDENMSDNSFALRQIVVGSFDPNDIQCLEGDIVPPSEIGDYLHYLIRFENTGNAPAQNIVIRDEINDSEYDVSSIQILNTSHRMTNASVKGNLAEFVLKNVSIDSGGHGNILLKVKSKQDLTAESTISHRVGIYFDYNSPVITNDATTIFKALSLGEHELDKSIMIYPNPVSKLLNVKADSTIRSVQLFDAQGRILMTQLLGENNTILDLSAYANGVYYIKILTDEGAKTEKVVNKKN